MAQAVTFAAGGIGPRGNGEWSKQKRGTYGRLPGQDNVHLEPLGGTAGRGRANGGYGYEGFPGEESQPYLVPQSYQRSRSGSQTYRPPPEYDNAQGSEAASLYPSHARSHSRGPSMDATSAREMV